MLQYLRGVIRGPYAVLEDLIVPHLLFRGLRCLPIIVSPLTTALALQAQRKSPDLVFSLLNRGFPFHTLNSVSFTEHWRTLLLVAQLFCHRGKAALTRGPCCCSVRQPFWFRGLSLFLSLSNCLLSSPSYSLYSIPYILHFHLFCFIN